MNSKDHWEHIYGTKDAAQVSWFKPHLDQSVELITGLALNKDAPIIDIGGGASTLVDDLLNSGFTDITVLDISEGALRVSKNRLADRSRLIQWVAADITQADLPGERFALWHDRAVFHFLTQPSDRKKYIRLLGSSLQPKGYAAVATFSLEGPPKCSGLEVVRYSPSSLHAELGKGFRLISSVTEDHSTPFETVQKFVYCLFQKN